MQAKTKHYRPWGYYEVLYSDETCKVKRIKVYPGEKLSYQYHNRRSEVWTIVEGRAIVILNEIPVEKNPGDIVQIPEKMHHRIVNFTNDDVVFIEVQTGSYFGEDDIVRLEDDYGR